MDNTKTKHWYEYRLRGFSLGCQPKGFVDVDPTRGGKFGSIAYDRELTEEEMDRFELNYLESEKID